MILIDFSQIALSNIIVQKLSDEGMIRHSILNSIRMYNKKYRAEYGQMVICADGANSWRKQYYPEYKANRKKAREERNAKAEADGQDWNEIFRVMNQILVELRENFPYKVVHLEGCEGDDIIGALAIRTQDFGQHEPVMIISSDKDFKQLQKYDNIKQFSPIQKKDIKEANPRSYIFEHICKGDAGDGVPNVRSPDNAFTDSIRQLPVTKKSIQIWSENIDNLRNFMTEEEYRNYQRNKTLIDLHEIPEDIYNNIIKTYDEQKLASKLKVMNYLVKNRLRNLVECTEEFYNG